MGLLSIFSGNKRKPCLQNRDTHRALLAADIHACNECGAWEMRGLDSWREEIPILHELTCSFYPSPANLEHEARLKVQGHWKTSKWNLETREGYDNATPVFVSPEKLDKVLS